MEQIDSFRLSVMKQIAGTASLQTAWPFWEKDIRRRLVGQDPGMAIFSLGEKLADIFKLTGAEGRAQSTLSGAGNAWECLIAWYLNLVFFKTNVVVAKKNKSTVPSGLLNALAVTISNHSTNSESDLVAYALPRPETSLLDSTLDLLAVDQTIRIAPQETMVTVIQCKTNWNDNAQVPMLWDLVYNSHSMFKIPNVSVGTKGLSPGSFKRFSYAFVTVPTSSGVLTPKSLAVLRVKNLSGGNYWGHASQEGVAACLNEFFQRNFPMSFEGGVQYHLQKAYSEQPEMLEKFLALDF